MKRHQLRHTLARTGAHILEARNSKHEGNEVSLTLKSAYITALYDLQLISKPSTRLKLSCTWGAWEDLVRMFFFSCLPGISLFLPPILFFVGSAE